ncbi:restriction endonuclease [Sphaerotilus hippei]|uniref:Restriction endonuclease n=1 Tax=Sphaerotilus hippei TaxID=744406 RepID=A0A318H0W1_9BURK|nr:restriction endonuclease [Sphaerotilus hippei]PXW96578.1 restriction endonuclease [Sphaerotilus hippei]
MVRSPSDRRPHGPADGAADADVHVLGGRLSSQPVVAFGMPTDADAGIRPWRRHLRAVFCLGLALLMLSVLSRLSMLGAVVMTLQPLAVLATIVSGGLLILPVRWLQRLGASMPAAERDGMPPARAPAREPDLRVVPPQAVDVVEHAYPVLDNIIPFPPRTEVSVRRHPGPGGMAPASPQESLHALFNRLQQQRLAATPSRRAPSPWSQALIDQLDEPGLVALVERLFIQAGFLPRLHARAGGADLWLQSASQPDGRPVSLVRCRHRRAGEPWRCVDAVALREQHAVMQAHRIVRGQFVTNGRFGTEAVEFARQHRIHLLDRDTLLTLVQRRTPVQQQALLDTVRRR